MGHRAAAGFGVPLDWAGTYVKADVCDKRPIYDSHLLIYFCCVWGVFRFQVFGTQLPDGEKGVSYGKAEVIAECV